MMNSEILIVRKTQKNQAYGYGLTYNSFWYLFAWKTPVESLSWGWVSRNAVNILTGDSNDHLLNYAITIWVKHIVIFLFVNILLDLASSAVKVSRIALNLWPYDSVNDLLNHLGHRDDTKAILMGVNSLTSMLGFQRLHQLHLEIWLIV